MRKVLTRIKNFCGILISKRHFFPKNYLLWVSLYSLIEYYRPTTNNPFSSERFSSSKLSFNEVFLILLIAHPILIYIDTYSLAKFLKSNLVRGRFYICIGLGISFVLFKIHMDRFEHFGDDGLLYSLFYGLSYLTVLTSIVVSFFLGSRIVR